jgi:murein DD-endopeptidase MepM/ murein hydrolase activator NlpD
VKSTVRVAARRRRAAVLTAVFLLAATLAGTMPAAAGAIATDGPTGDLARAFVRSAARGTFPYRFPLRRCGRASYGTTHHDYPATDIFAPRGTRVLAVTNGVVDAVNRVDRWRPEIDAPATRGGKFVSIVGDDGVRYYTSHLDSVTHGLHRGDRVRVGSTLGRLGQTGNARLSVPHLHFGISHPTYPGDWETRRGEVWPYRYLRAWCAGRDVTPELP